MCAFFNAKKIVVRISFCPDRLAKLIRSIVIRGLPLDGAPGHTLVRYLTPQPAGSFGWEGACRTENAVTRWAGCATRTYIEAIGIL